MGNQPGNIGVDLGGQSVKLAVVAPNGTLTLKRQVAIDADWSAAELAALIVEQVDGLRAEANDSGWHIDRAGIVMPGYMDRERTRLLTAANLPRLGGTDFLARLRADLDLPVVFDADCNAAAVGEACFGAGRGVSRLIVVAVGTGIGAGVILDGQVLRIFNHIAGSLGHVIVDANGPRCACGARGCVESRASGRALERLAGELAEAAPESRLAELRGVRGRLTGVEIGEALSEGDAAAERAVREAGWWLGAGIAAWSAVYAPHKIVVGGGVIGLGEKYLDAVRAGLRDVGQPFLTRELTIAAAQLGPDAGIIGAAAMARSRP